MAPGAQSCISLRLREEGYIFSISAERMGYFDASDGRSYMLPPSVSGPAIALPVKLKPKRSESRSV